MFKSKQVTNRMFPWKFAARVIRAPRHLVAGAKVVENNRRYGLDERMPSPIPGFSTSFDYWFECNRMGGVQDDEKWC